MLKLILCFLVSLIAVLILMPYFIRWMKRKSVGQSISEYSLSDDQKKAGTPIMGGLLFIAIPVLVTLVSSPAAVKDIETWIVILAFVGYGVIGFIDDWLIAVRHDNTGLKPMQKFLMQVVLAVVFFMLYRSHARLEVILPIGHHVWHLGRGYFILVLFMFVGSSNAVNLTDGMDGLAAGCSIIALLAYFVICMVQHRIGVSVLVISLIGALLGYLYYNKKPAKVFMGDTGSLALGGILAAIAMVTKTEISLILIAGVFVIDTLTVIIQITSVKLRHKKVFPYTPIHFAFRLAGMPEKSVVLMFWLVEAVCAGLGLLLALH
jgi:phospho-N-acetylmuramoyl-pentapeptide-transferase